MKTFIILALMAVGQAFASDSYSDTLHSRMIEREPHLYSASNFVAVEEVPEEIAALQLGSVLELVEFARDYDLFSKGFFYELNNNMYEVVKENEVIGYTYSVNILKNDVLTHRRFYILNKRVDGVFYLGRIVTYDIVDP